MFSPEKKLRVLPGPGCFSSASFPERERERERASLKNLPSPSHWRFFPHVCDRKSIGQQLYERPLLFQEAAEPSENRRLANLVDVNASD